MTDPTDPGYGPGTPAAPEAAPFSVTGPSAASLDSSRKGVTSFVVANTTGRPVTARLLPQALNGADAGWISIDPPLERPMTVAGTMTVDVKIAVPEKVPAGEHALRLDVAVEDTPNRVASGPTAVFTVPEAVKKRKFPWWIILVIVGALLLLGGGAWAIWTFVLNPDDDPVPTPTITETAEEELEDPVSASSPTITGTAEIGEALTVVEGTWDPEEVVLLHSWQSCPAAADPADPVGCTDITLTSGSETIPASGPTLIVSASLEGLRIRVVEVALNVGPDSAEEIDPAALEDVPHASAASAPTEAVPAAPPETVPVPSVETLTIGQALTDLQAVGLVGVPDYDEALADTCDPVVTDQIPAAGQQLQVASEVSLKALKPPAECFVLNLDWPVYQLPNDVVIPDDWFQNPVIPELGGP